MGSPGSVPVGSLRERLRGRGLRCPGLAGEGREAAVSSPVGHRAGGSRLVALSRLWAVRLRAQNGGGGEGRLPPGRARG